ncbi:DNA binding protein [Loxospora ochrophaea]|nr:DNA binding protein [Loxospora ochrophaea]
MAFVRGRSASVDRLLKWLDGIFDALKRNFLAAVQLSVVLDENNPSNVVESYTFSFKYSNHSKSIDRHLVGVTTPGSQDEPVTLESARYDQQEIFCDLVNLTQQLPDLPG